MKNKIILSLVIISLLISYLFPIISLGNYTSYLALGDSVPAGYYLEYPEKDNYAEKLRQKLNISSDNFQNLASSGETTKKLYNDMQSTEWTNAISNSNLITLTVGANELSEIISEAFSYATGVPMTNDLAFNDRVALTFLNADLSTKIDMISSLYEYCTSLDFQKRINEKLVIFEEYLPKVIDYIKEVNPTATIVATEYYNPYYEISILNFDFGGFIDDFIQKLNNIIYKYSDSETNYKIAKIYSVFNTTNPRLTYANLSLTDFGYDPHPTVLGHEIISLKILEELSTDNTIQNKKDISTLSISNIKNQEYTGNAIRPEIKIKDGNFVLVENQDYVVVYNNNIETGQASAIIIGIGNYTGQTTKTFNIQNSNIKDISTCQIEPLEYQLYLGMNLEPDVVILDGSKVLEKNTDYTLKYHNNVNVGMGTVTITGVGNYTGTVTTNFIIAPMPISTTTVHDISDQLYTGKEITPEVIISFGAVKLIEDTDYTLEYENNINKGTATITITGKGNYSGTMTKEFNIVSTIDSQLQNLSNATVSKIDDKTYTGNCITPIITVTLNEETLKQNEDYKIFYSNNINVGTGIATIVGIGDYTGTIETSFNIVKKSIENLNITDISNQTYTGKSIEPKVIITDKSTKLKENVDYTVSFYNNTEIGLATIQIHGKGNYTGTLFKTFHIVEAPPVVDNENKPQGNNSNNIQNIPGDAIDKTTSSNILPNAGTTIKFLIAITFFIALSISFYKLSKKWY